jgi:hypothetical protein
MINLFRKLKQRKCKHDWKATEFQKLTDDCSLSYECTKCGKWERMIIVREVKKK